MMMGKSDSMPNTANNVKISGKAVWSGLTETDIQHS